MNAAAEPRVSVIVCTHNRADFAIDCVGALLGSRGAHLLEIIVVDNASDAKHQTRLAEWARAPLRLLFEPNAGLSHARNKGAGEASTEWLAYLDDDALPHSDWIERALEVTADDAHEVGMIGGAVLPRWPDVLGADSVEPSRLGSRWRTLLSLIESERVESGSTVPNIVGCNMLIRATLLKQIGGFPTELGRTPSSLLGGEEVVIARKVAALGFGVGFEPRLRVDHRIGTERLGTHWVRRRAHAEGELLWRCSPSAAITAKVLLSIPYLALASLLQPIARRTERNYDYHVRLWNNLGFAKSAAQSVVAKPFGLRKSGAAG